ncbi:major facilitator superfamily domain-containing protein [Aspergillus granulosus]|uniref:Major facilitator superfamily domain-containing protein n=1 Tax=Aspergillus granulosus TaxID=176169 RepID=A0ABR4HXT8_9EURO
MASEATKSRNIAHSVDEDAALAEIDVSSEKICFSRYNSPFWQVVIVSFVAFGCPGMYNALSGIGGGGQLDTTTQAKGHIALASVSAAGNIFVAPIVNNMLGPKWTIFIGGLPYVLYAGSLLAFTHIHNQGFVVGASAILGIGASLLWISQGSIMTGYPLPQQQGRMIGVFWIIFNLGGFLGSMISFGLNFHSASGTVSDSTYIAFMCIMAGGCCCALGLLNPYNVIREDRSRAAVAKKPSVWGEFVQLVKVIKDWRVVSLIPFWMAANYAYNYQQNSYNAKLFNIRTRSFNGGMYWLAQMVSSYIFGLFLDNKYMNRRQRGLWGFVITAIISMVVWAGGLAAQLRRSPTSNYYALGEMDLIDSGAKYAGPFVLYFAYGAFDAVWQTLVYWTIGYLSHESPEQAARYVGAFKCMEAVGSAIASKVNSDKTNYNVEFAVDWAFVVFALVWVIPFAWSIQDAPPHAGQETVYAKEETEGDRAI